MHFHRYCFMLRLLCIYSFNGQVISTPMQSSVFHFKEKELFTCTEFDHPILNLYFPCNKRNFNHDLKKRTRKDFSLSKLSCRTLIISTNKYRIFNIFSNCFRGTFNNFLYSFIDWWLVQCRRRFMIDLW